jgi:hypothetical protein
MGSELGCASGQQAFQISLRCERNPWLTANGLSAGKIDESHHKDREEPVVVNRLRYEGIA